MKAGVDPVHSPDRSSPAPFSGLLADNWLGTEPWLVVIGALVGSYSGFMNMWRWSKEMEMADRER